MEKCYVSLNTEWNRTLRIINTRQVLLFLFIMGFMPTNAHLNSESLINLERYVSFTIQDVQDQTIVQGTVVDQDGAPLPGANILEKGTTNGTQSDIQGKFSIQLVDDQATLIISYVGYTTLEVPTNGQTYLDLKMHINASGLDEVVVVGYTTQKKKNITGSVETVNVTEDMHLAVTTASGNLLRGRIAGVFVGTPNGAPGEQPNISIRQNSSWNNQNVLYVIDGVVKGSGDFNNLSPNEIATFTVLKDASAAAIYGARAAGGVIVVTTRRGDPGKMKIDYSYSYGEDTRTKNVSLTSAVELGQLYNRMFDNTNSGYYTQEDFDHLKNINNGWGYDQLGEVWTNPSIATHNFSVSGGSDKIKYFGGISNIKQKTFIESYGFEKTNVRFNTTINITDNLQFFAGMALHKTDKEQPYFTDYVASDPAGLYAKLLRWQPWQPVYTDNGQYAHYGWVANVGAEANNEAGYNNTYIIKPDVNVNLTYKIPGLDGLSAKVAYASSWTNSHNDQFKKSYEMAVLPQNDSGHIIDTRDENILGWKTNSISYPSLTKVARWSNDFQFNLQLNYNRVFGKHDVSGVIAYESAEANGSSVYGGREKVPVYLTDQFWGFSNARSDTYAGGDPSFSNGRKSVIGQANYIYDNKYMVSASIRNDGSMNFAPDYRWGVFPAASLGWVISEEDFFSGAKKAIDRLKLSASFGVTGNDSVGGWQWQESYQTGNKSYFGEGGNNVSQGIKYGSIVNPNITWEKTRSYNFRADIEFMRHWNATLEYWLADTHDILGKREASVPTSFSGSLPAENYGEVKAQGFDFNIGYNNKIGDLSYFVNGNVSYGWNEVVTQDYAQNAQNIDIPVGKSRNRIVGYQSEPIIRTQGDLDAFNASHPGYKLNGWEPYIGMLPIKDISGPDGTPDNVINSWDRVEINDDNTAINFGLSLGSEYKGFSLEAVFSGQAGFDKSYRDITGNVEWNRMFTGWLYDSWTPENPNASLPKSLPYYNSASTTYRDVDSDFWYRDASYVRLQYLNFGYNFKELSRIKAINNLKLYVTGSNLFVISKFNKNFWDPQGSALSYPIVKSFSVGLNVGF